jgi:hypothetical protein
MNQPTAAMTNMTIQKRLAWLLEEHLAAHQAGDQFTTDVCYGGIYALSQLAADLELTGASIAAAKAMVQCHIHPRTDAA